MGLVEKTVENRRATRNSLDTGDLIVNIVLQEATEVRERFGCFLLAHQREAIA